MLRYYARKGDLENYRRTLKKSDRRRARNELIRIERTFVASYSRKVGIKRALEGLDHEKPWLVLEAIEAQVGRLPYSSMSVSQKEKGERPAGNIRVCVGDACSVYYTKDTRA